MTVGGDIRSLRNIRRLSLAELAGRLNRSIGWLSQIERGISSPSEADLQNISRELGVPVSLLFDNAPGPENERGFVVRKENRRDASAMAGLREQLLSPDLTDDFEVLLVVHEAGASLEEAKIRDTREVVYLISGRLDLIIAGRSFKVAAGDSFRVRGEAFQWFNPYPEPATAIWVISPPIY